MKFKKGDQVRKTVPSYFLSNTNPVGKVIDVLESINLVCLEFDDKTIEWYNENHIEKVHSVTQIYTMPSYGSINTSILGWDISSNEYENIVTLGDLINERKTGYCKHDWKNDTYFTPKVFTTCTKCGAKKEET